MSHQPPPPHNFMNVDVILNAFHADITVCIIKINKMENPVSPARGRYHMRLSPFLLRFLWI